MKGRIVSLLSDQRTIDGLSFSLGGLVALVLHVYGGFP